MDDVDRIEDPNFHENDLFAEDIVNRGCGYLNDSDKPCIDWYEQMDASFSSPTANISSFLVVSHLILYRKLEAHT